MSFVVKERIEMAWALISLALGQLFAFTQCVPDLSTLVSTNSRFAFGLALGFCAGATFFLMGLPVIEVLSEVLNQKRTARKGAR